MKTLKTKLAFTLIELLFVIAIVGVLASIGIALTQQRTQKAKIEQAALQMQQILQSALAYYSTNSCWPETNTPAICKGGKAPYFYPYLPFGGGPDVVVTNPWGGTYSYGPVNDGTQPAEKRFRVCTEANDSAIKVGLSDAIARRISALLPNAKSVNYDGTKKCKETSVATLCTTGNCLAAAEVGEPGTGPGPGPTPGDVVIKGFGSAYFSANDLATGYATQDTATFSDCPTDTSLHLMVSMGTNDKTAQETKRAGYYAPDWDAYVGSVPAKDFSFYYNNCSGGKCTIHVNFLQRCDTKIISLAYTCSNPPKFDPQTFLGLSYIAYCQ